MLSFSRRKFLTLLAALPIAACGYQPVLKQGGAAQGLQGNIGFNLIESREGFVLLGQLEKRLGKAGPSARYQAAIDLIIEEDELELTALTGLVRYTLNGYAKLVVTDQTTGETVFSDKLRDVIGYSGNEQTLATTTSQRDATDKLILSLAEMIVLQLTSTAESWAG
ncbi:MAG: LPS-assembly lipoprotein [Paracoccaceae bacterium]|jgi:LPS-assembly lipoprotein